MRMRVISFVGHGLFLTCGLVAACLGFGGTTSAVFGDDFAGLSASERPLAELLPGSGGPQTIPQTSTATADRVQYSQKGDLFVWPYVVIRWDTLGTAAPEDDVALQDVFLSVVNDATYGVAMKFYFVDAYNCHAIDARCGLTGNNPVYFSAFSGIGGGVDGAADRGMFPAFRALKAAGYQDPEFPGDPTKRILRGYIVGWTVDGGNYPIGTNQLVASATVVDYRLEEAWEYKPWAFRSRFTGRKQATTVLRMNFDPDNYQKCPQMLLVDFWASGSRAFGPSTNAPIELSSQDFELTLLNAWMDFRSEPDFDGDGEPGSSPIDIEPATTTVQVLAWNEMEQPISGTLRCITCWDSTPASLYGWMGAMSPFDIWALQTDKGKARLSTLAAPNCSRPANPNSNPPIIAKPARNLPILGVAHRTITWTATRVAKTGMGLIGMGTRDDGVIYFDGSDQGDPPTMPPGSVVSSPLPESVVAEPPLVD